MSAARNLSDVLSIFEGLHTNYTVREIKLVHNFIILPKLFHFDQMFVFFYKCPVICNRVRLAYLSRSRPACTWIQKFSKVKGWWWLWCISWVLIVLSCLCDLAVPCQSHPDNNCDDRDANAARKDTREYYSNCANTHAA